MRSTQACLLAFAALLTACGDEDTAGEAITFEVALEALPEPGEPSALAFTTDAGWRIELAEARMVLAPIYLFERSSPLAARPASSAGWGTRLLNLVLPAAHAHEGDLFLVGGRVMGEWDQQVAFDLSAPGPQTLGLSPGIAGPAGSFSVLMQPPSPALDSAAGMEGGSLILRGVARRDGVTIAFRTRVAFPGPQESQRVDLVPADVVLQEGGVLTVGVRPAALFAGAKIDAVAPGADGQVEWLPDSQPHRAVQVNALRHTPYSARFQPAAAGAR